MQNLPKSIQTVQSLSLEALQEHAGWMRRLVGYMVRDSSRIDDLVQETWMAAIGNPPPAGLPLKAWLKGIASRTTMASRRGDARRKNRESRHFEDAVSVHGNVAQDTAELSACAEQQRLLMEALTKLPEGEKAVLLLRFFEDLPPRTIATRLNVPVNTVRNRQRLGLQRLRESLDREHKGDSNAWAVAFLPLAKMRRTSDVLIPAAKQTIWGIPVLVGRLIMLGLVTASLLGVWQYQLRTPGLENLERRTTAQEAIAQIEGWIETPLKAPLAQVRGAITASAPAAPTGPQLKGVVLDQANQPIPDVRIETSSEPLKNTVVVMGRADWMPAWARSNENGRFSVPAQAKGDALWVEATHPSFLQCASVEELRAGENATIRMVRTATTQLEIELVDSPSGRRGGTFKVLAFQRHDSLGEGYFPQSALSESAEGAQGLLTLKKRFAVDRPIHILISSAVGLYEEVDPESMRALVDGVEDGITHVRFELELDGPEQSGQFPLARGRVVDADTGMAIPVVEVSLKEDLYGPNDANRPERKVGLRTVTSNSNGEYIIAMPKGSQEASGHLFHPEYVSQDVALSANASFDTPIAMTKRGELRCRVIDGQGQPVPNAPLLIVQKQNSNPSSLNSRLRIATDKQGSFRLPNLLEGRVQIYVLRKPRDADENAIASDSFSIESGVSRDVVIQINPPDRVHVTGKVLAGTTVLPDVLPIFLPYSSDGGWVRSRKQPGGFSAGGLSRGSYLVVLISSEEGQAPLAWLPNIEIAGFGAQHLEIQMPNAQLTGRIAKNSGTQSTLVVLAVPTETEGFAKDLLGQSKLVRSFAHPVNPKDGSFLIPNLGLGSHRLSLWDTAHPDQGALATMQVQVDGSTRLADWIIPD
jgi:RNA polymerase sigma factor (sigma-70 family)